MSSILPSTLRSISRSSFRQGARAASPVLAASSKRTISSSPLRFMGESNQDASSPEYEKLRHATSETTPVAKIDNDYKYKYDPKDTAGDLGHQTTGEGHGRHNKRTLASLSMEGKVVVVTGAARGLGNLMARTFIECGSSKVAIIDLNEDDAKTAAKDMESWFVEHGEASPGEIEAVGYGCDVSNESRVKEVFASIKEKFGKIDCLVTAAGIVENFPALEYPTDRMNLLWGINVNGTYFCAREAAKVMVEQGKGSIVMVGSMSASIVNVPQAQAPYNASKAAVRHLAASMAVELAQKGVRVNCLSPGYMLTSLTKVVLGGNTELRDKWVSLTPAGRMGEPEDLKGAVIYLSSDSAAFTTGVDLKVDGGYTVI